MANSCLYRGHMYTVRQIAKNRHITWILCQRYRKWIHEDCANVNDQTNTALCIVCTTKSFKPEQPQRKSKKEKPTNDPHGSFYGTDSEESFHVSKQSRKLNHKKYK